MVAANCQLSTPSGYSEPNPAKEHIYGFDWLRAIFSIAVVVVHLGYLSPSLIFDHARWREHVFIWSDAVNFYVLLLAVPVFIMMSCFLVAKSPQLKLGRRIWRIGRLFLFWAVLLNLYQYVVGDAIIHRLPRQPIDLIKYVVSGFQTPFYFFVSLMIMTMIAAWARARSTKVVASLLVATLFLVGFLPIVARITGEAALCHFAMPLNFTPYPLAAVIAIRVPRSQFRLLISMLIAVGVILASLDWSYYIDPIFFQVNAYPLPTYTRPSLVFLAAAVVLAATRFKFKPYAITTNMSKHSLALYCLHPFYYLNPFALSFGERFTKMIGLHWIPAQASSLLVILIFSYFLSSLVLPQFLRRELFN